MKKYFDMGCIFHEKVAVVFVIIVDWCHSQEKRQCEKDRKIKKKPSNIAKHIKT